MNGWWSVVAFGWMGCSPFDAAPTQTESDGGVVTPNDASSPTVDGGSTSDCPGTAGPKGVRVGMYCIDATEVTRSQYAAFLTAMPARPNSIPSCVSNSSYVPRSDWPPAPGEQDRPVMAVDWCDAHDFCAWAGKRLCGKIGGGPVAPADAQSAKSDQWFAACSKAGLRSFPYEGAYDAVACNGGESTPLDKRVRDVATYGKCEGGYPGVFDLSGNVWEWVDACNADAADPATTSCRVRGGDFNEGPATMGCSASVSQPRIGPGRFGFRCCSN